MALLTIGAPFGASAAADGAGAAQGMAGEGLVVRHARSGGVTAQDVREYWTARRMQAAKPLRLDRPTAEAAGDMQTPNPSALPPAGQPVHVPADPSGNASSATLRRREVGAGSGLDSGRFSQATQTFDTTAFPARTHGKVFLTLGSDDYVCSATAVTTEAENVVFTAGHCVNDPELGWASKWEFVPAYHDGKAPFGEFAATDLRSPESWTQDEDVSFDLGAAVLGTNGSGEKIEAEVGARGIAFNQSRYQHYTSWGYPAAPPAGGELLYSCQSNWVMAYPDPTPGGPPPMGIGCDMAGGSSGGGWVIDDQYVNSVNSFGHPSYPGIMFGPYFGNAARNLYLTVCECTLDTTPPNTMITSGPAGITSDATPTFGFTSTGTALSFKCKFDGGAYAACTSPNTTAALADGFHTFSVRGIDAMGNTDPTPAERSFTVDTTPPAITPPADITPPMTAITKGAPKATEKTKLKFKFRSDEEGSTFECKLDKNRWKPCPSPKTVKRLDDGRHKFQVRATDLAGNVDPTPAKDRFKVVD